MACSFNDADGLYVEDENYDKNIAEHKKEMRKKWLGK